MPTVPVIKVTRATLNDVISIRQFAVGRCVTVPLGLLHSNYTFHRYIYFPEMKKLIENGMTSPQGEKCGLKKRICFASK